MAKNGLKITYWIFTIVFAAFMLFSGFSSIFTSSEGNEVMDQLGYPLYLNLILGFAKIFGSVAILQNKWNTIKEWAYAGFTFDIIGASLSFAFIGAGFVASSFPLVFLVVMFVSYSLWKKLY